MTVFPIIAKTRLFGRRSDGFCRREHGV